MGSGVSGRYGGTWGARRLAGEVVPASREAARTALLLSLAAAQLGTTSDELLERIGRNAGVEPERLKKALLGGVPLVLGGEGLGTLFGIVLDGLAELLGIGVLFYESPLLVFMKYAYFGLPKGCPANRALSPLASNASLGGLSPVGRAGQRRPRVSSAKGDSPALSHLRCAIGDSPLWLPVARNMRAPLAHIYRCRAAGATDVCPHPAPAAVGGSPQRLPKGDCPPLASAASPRGLSPFGSTKRGG